MSTDIELLPCPFCASENLSIETNSVQPDDFHDAYVVCGDCDARGRGAMTLEGWLSSKDEASAEAIVAWNRRPTPQAPAPAAPEGQAEARQEDLQRERMRKVIAGTRTAASLLNEGGFRAGMEAACDGIETSMALDAAPLPRQAAVRGEDAARLDWLEQRGNDGGLLLHAGNQETGGHSGLGLINTGRTLRQAVDSARGVKPHKSAPATTEKDA